MCFGSTDKSTRLLQQQEADRAAAINQGVVAINQAFQGYNPEFYRKVSQNVLNTSLPQLSKQYQQQVQQLGTTFQNKGMLQSSAARNAQSALTEQLGLNKLALGNQAIAAAQGMQQQVQQQKSQLTNQLVASANPSLAAQQAVEGAASIQLPSMVAPLANMFQDWSRNYLAGGLTQAYQNPSASPSILGNLGFRNPSTAPLPRNFGVG